MSKELEALERLTRIHNFVEFKECYSLIETALKRLEMYDSVEKSIKETAPCKCILNDDGSIEMEGANDFLLVPKIEYQKKVKTLKIIKDKVMSLVSLDDEEICKGHYRVYDGELYGHTELTKEEYELLEEMVS